MLDHAWGYGSEQRLREENQDCHGVFEFPDFTLAVVCDGMGGHVGGAQASSLAVRTIHDTLVELQGRPVREALEEAIQRTNVVIYEAARKNHRLMGMGTTVVAAAVTDDKCYLAHVGDSRAYLVRRGQVQQLTRDHTMVNLFVDAELLSPEDAATHPEAHVLSRSLGVERQVDVDVADPIQLDKGDVIFLCSDGVHGVLTDWELANVDWRAPNEGVRRVLGIVASREGDDNATAVAVLMGTSFEDVPATAPPEPKRFDEVAAASGMTAVPFDEDIYESHGRSDPDTGGSSPGYIVYESQPAPEQAPAPMVMSPSLKPPVPAAQAGSNQPPVVAPPATAPKVQPSAKKRSPVLPVLVATGALVLALGAAAFLLLPGDGTTVVDDPELSGNIDITGPGVAPKPDPIASVTPPKPTDAAPPVEPVPAALPTAAELAALPLFKPQIAVAPRRLPHRPTKFTQPAPGGPFQHQAAEAAKRRDCPTSLDQVQQGMKQSIDYATLYRIAWTCFGEAHQRPLTQAEVQNWESFRYFLAHFDGTPESRTQMLAANPDLKKLPSWYLPSTGGLSFRIERWSNDDQMHEVLVDLFGEPNLADQVAVDLQLFAAAAEGLSRIPPEQRKDPAIEETWARMVYVLAKAIRGRPGHLLNTHRYDPPLLDALNHSLEVATTPREVDGKKWPVPPEVLRALEAGFGRVDVTARPVAPKPVDPKSQEPDLGGDDDPIRLEVHKAGGGR